MKRWRKASNGVGRKMRAQGVGCGEGVEATGKSRRGDETSSIERFLKGDANRRPFKGILAKGTGDLVDPPTGSKRIRGGSFVVFRFANRATTKG